MIGFENLLLAGDVELEVGGDEIGELRGIRQIGDENLQLVREPRALGDQSAELLRDAPHERRRFDGLGRLPDILDPADRGAQIGIGRGETFEPHARHALNEQPIRFVRKLQHLHDAQHRPDRVDVVDARRSVDVALHRGADEQPIGAHEHLVDQSLRRRRIHEQRREEVREQHRILERQHRQLFGEFGHLVHVVGEPARNRDLGPTAALFDRSLLFLLFRFFVHRSSIPAQPLFGATGVKRSALFRLDRQRPPRRAAFGNPDLEKAVLEARAN